MSEDLISNGEHVPTPTHTASPKGDGPCMSVSARPESFSYAAVCAANGALSLLNLCIYLVKRQLDAQAAAFEKEGGFTERLYRVRSARRKGGPQ